MEQGGRMTAGASSGTRFLLVFFSTLALLVISVLLIHRGMVVDDIIENFFFDRLHPHINPLDAWLWPKTNKMLTFWLHDGFHYVFYAIAALCAVICIASLRHKVSRHHGYQALLVLLALALVPGTVAIVKNDSQRYCPSKIDIYGGYVANDYKNHPIPETELVKADCFPAAHPSASFALMILGAIAVTRRGRIMGYALGFGMGSLLSLFQMGRGEHFFSHCLATFLIALWIVHILVYTGDYIVAYARRRNKPWQLSPTEMKLYES
jgi:membrane-associated PAP2 superfamily phosphatase